MQPRGSTPHGRLPRRSRRPPAHRVATTPLAQRPRQPHSPRPRHHIHATGLSLWRSARRLTALSFRDDPGNGWALAEIAGIILRASAANGGRAAAGWPGCHGGRIGGDCSVPTLACLPRLRDRRPPTRWHAAERATPSVETFDWCRRTTSADWARDRLVAGLPLKEWSHTGPDLADWPLAS